MPLSETAFRKLALDQPDEQWELDRGVPRKKPGMTAAHNEISLLLAADLLQQLDREQFRVRHNAGHVRRSAERYYIPDVSVIPTHLVLPQLSEPSLEVYEAPLPLVVEVWSPSTGDYDVRTKLVEYQRRGDLGVWLLHPYDRVLTARVR